MKDRIKKIFCFEFYIVLIYMTFTFITLMLHEPWFDEAQSWMIAKDLDVPGIISQMKYEGHSALWSLILHVFVKLGFNYNIQNIFVWFLSVLGVIFFMYKVNISNLVKVPFLFTVGSLYYCSVFARPYVLIFLIMILLLYYYDKRYEHPFIVSILLVILSNTHLMVMGFLGALFLIEFYGLIKKKDYKKERIILMSSMVFGVFIFFLQIVGSLISRPDIINTKSGLDYIYIFARTIKAFLYSHSYFSILMFLSFVLTTVIIIYIFKENKESFFVFICSSLFFVLLSTFVYYLNDFKYFFIILLILFCTRNLFYNKVLFYTVIIFLLCGIYTGINESIRDWNNVYSKELYIAKDVLSDKDEPKIISFCETAVLAMYCNECDIYNINVNKYVSYNPYINYLTDEGVTYDNIVNVINSDNIDYVLIGENYYTNKFFSDVISSLVEDGIMKLSKVYEKGLISDEFYLFVVDKK